MLNLRTLTSAVTPAGAEVSAGLWRAYGLSKTFGETQALHDVSLSVSPGEVVAVTGPSGAGKSTLGRLISGLEVPVAGRIVLDGTDISAMPARLRRVAHMFESFALYPTKTVQQNVASPLNAPASAGRFDATERRQRVEEVLALTEMANLRDRLPSQLSGGQKQRVALCRALVQDPSIFVLDEPIGHLDAKLRHHLRGEIRRRQANLRQGTLWLTPDGVEAMAVADRMVVLIGGRIQQFDTPDAVFARPANVAVARLLGDPAMNVIEILLKKGDKPALDFGDGAWVPITLALAVSLSERANAADRLLLGLRPTELRLLPVGTPAADRIDTIPGIVYVVEPLGKHVLVTVEVAGQRMRIKTDLESSWVVGEPVHLTFAFDRVLFFDVDSGKLHD
jgi:multiple sugar transport system ATP-binding protein